MLAFTTADVNSRHLEICNFTCEDSFCISYATLLLKYIRDIDIYTISEFCIEIHPLKTAPLSNISIFNIKMNTENIFVK